MITKMFSNGKCFLSGVQIARFMGPTWGPPGSCRPQMGPMLATWTLLSGCKLIYHHILRWSFDLVHHRYFWYKSCNANINIHYSEVIWISWCCKSPAIWLFVQQHRNVQSSASLALCDGNSLESLIKCQWYGKYFHVMASSWTCYLSACLWT